MQPRTSVRQPIIAGARRRQLSELLRQWRRQPRKRSPLLFWALLSLALMSDSGLLLCAARLLGTWGTESSQIELFVCATSSCEEIAARQALYWSLLAVGFFMAAAAVKLRRPQWRRRLGFAGVLSSLGCLGCAGAAFFHQAIYQGVTPIYEGSRCILWSAAMIMGLGLSLAVLFRDAFLALTGALVSSLGFFAARYEPSAFIESWRFVPQEIAGDKCLYMQVWILLLAYAALALAWGVAILTLMRIVLAAPSNERLRRLATLCLGPIHLGMALLAVSTLLDGWQSLPQLFVLLQNLETYGWNAQALGTLLFLPACTALVCAQWRGWLPPFRFLTAVALGFPFLMMAGSVALRWPIREWHIDAALPAEMSFYLAGLIPLSLAAHAALRYYFGKQRILEV